MMAKSNKSKWIIGISGAALSAFVITQVGSSKSQNQGATAASETIKTVHTGSLSKEEADLVQLDWTNYSINGTAAADPVTVTNAGSSTAVTTGGVAKSDGQTRRS